MNLRKYLIPEFVIGDNAMLLAGRYCQNFGAKKILLVTDEGIIKAGWLKEVVEILDSNKLEYVIFKDLTENPKDYEVEEGANVYKKEHCNVILALGGGSVIDCAKGIGIVSTNKLDINQFEGVDKVQSPMPPLICIPTTAGSSADISQFAIISNTREHRKIAIISKSVVPDISLLDAFATTTMDKQLTITTGIDALVHAIEAYVSNASSPITDANALEAIKLITEYLPKAVEKPCDLAFRNKVMLGSLLAGMAFSNASLGLVHAMAHSMGGVLNVAHGYCNAILLEHSIQVNFESSKTKYENIYNACFAVKNSAKQSIKYNLIQYIKDFRDKLGMQNQLNLIGSDSIDYKKLAQNAFNDPCLATNPQDVSVEQIQSIYERIF